MKCVNARVSYALLTVLLIIPFVSVRAQEKSNFKPNGDVFVQFFGDYYYKLSGNSHPFSTAEYSGQQKDANAFDIRRVYFGYTYNFTPKITGKIELAHEENYLGDRNRAFYLKDAEVKIKDIIPYGNLIVGHTATPTFATFTEHIWGYRSVEKTLMDMRKLGGSNDLGVALEGNFNKEGTVGYTVMIGNGTGAKPENNKYKKVYLEVHARLDNKYLLEAYTDYAGSSVNGINTGTTTLKGFAGYQIPDFTLGVSVATQIRKNAVQNYTMNSDPAGVSIFTHGTLIKDKLNGFARYDFYNPDKSGNYKENFLLFGLDYLAAKNVHFMPNFWINGYGAKNGSPTTKADVVARVTFFYKF